MLTVHPAVRVCSIYSGSAIIGHLVFTGVTVALVVPWLSPCLRSKDTLYRASEISILVLVAENF